MAEVFTRKASKGDHWRIGQAFDSCEYVPLISSSFQIPEKENIPHDQLLSIPVITRTMFTIHDKEIP